MGARVVEGTGLENRRRLTPVRGFESHSIRYNHFIFLSTPFGAFYTCRTQDALLEKENEIKDRFHGKRNFEL